MKNSWESKKNLAYGKRFFVFTSIMLVLLFAFSCSNLIMNDGGSLIIAVPGARAASASSYTIELTGANGTTQRKNLAGGTTAQFDDLAPDTYNIVVEGMDTNNKVVLGGASSATVVAGETASTTVELVEGVGDFAGLVEAIAAGGTVNILKSINVETTLSISNTVTIVPVYQDVTLKNTGSGNLFTVSTGGELTIGGRNHTIALDGNQVAQSIISMSGGKATLADNGIIRNAAASGVQIPSGTFNMTGGEISGNTANGFGGGVRITGGIFNFSGGRITGNSGSNTSGKGVYISTSSSTFTMSGDAVVAPDNDVYFVDGMKITVAGTLSGTTPVATITPASYAASTQVLYSAEAFTLADAVSKFAVTPDNDGKKWTINTSGNLQQVTQ